MSQTKLEQTGLSLIEIVIVLALFGLIIALVFLALPIAQRGRRDAQRKQYLQEIAANVEKYKESTANGSQYPDTQATFNTAFGSAGAYHVSGVLGDKDPLTNTIYNYAALRTPGALSAGIEYTRGTNCTSSSGQGNGIYRLRIGLEVSGPYCLDNH